jgi:hypothetical protein
MDFRVLKYCKLPQIIKVDSETNDLVTITQSYAPHGTVTAAYGFTGEMADVTELTYLCSRRRLEQRVD